MAPPAAPNSSASDLVPDWSTKRLERRRATWTEASEESIRSGTYIQPASVCQGTEQIRQAGYHICTAPNQSEPVFGSHQQLFALGIHATANMSMAKLQHPFGAKWFIRLDRMVNFVQKKVKMTKYGLNIGANDGKTLGPDPMYHVFDSQKIGYDGICVEPDPVAFSKLRRNLPEKRIKKVNMPMTPREVPAFLEKYQVPQNPDVIKMDIDSFDCDLLEAFVQHRQFKLIHTEINFEIPVPMMFARKWSPGINFCMRPFGFYGCSLSYQVHMLEKYGYIMLQLWDFDATFIHKSIAHVFVKHRYIDYVTQFYSTLKVMSGISGKGTGHLKHPKRKWIWREGIMKQRYDTTWESMLAHFAEAANDCAARVTNFTQYNSALKAEFTYKGLLTNSNQSDLHFAVWDQAALKAMVHQPVELPEAL